jgi:hypothetical protein
MLRITMTHTTATISIKLEGSIRGPWVAELENAWRQLADIHPVHPIRVDLTGVSFADQNGRKVLLEMKTAGAVISGASTFLSHLLAEKPKDFSGFAPDQREN